MMRSASNFFCKFVPQYKQPNEKNLVLSVRGVNLVRKNYHKSRKLLSNSVASNAPHLSNISLTRSKDEALLSFSAQHQPYTGYNLAYTWKNYILPRHIANDSSNGVCFDFSYIRDRGHTTQTI